MDDTQPTPLPIEPTTTPQVPEKPVDKGGRPTVMTPEVIENLRKAFMFGATDAQACAFANIGVATLYNYQKANPEFLDIKEEWKHHPILKAKITIYNKLSDVDTAKWYLERKAKDEFGTRQEITGADGEQLIPRLIERLDRQNRTDYARLAEQAQRQVVAIEQSIQDKEQTGGNSDISSQPPTGEALSAESGTPLQSNPQG